MNIKEIPDIMRIVNEVLEACISSAKAKPMKLHERGKIKEIRGQLHVMLLMPFGGGKGTMIKEQIPDKLKFELKNYRLPGIVGTVTRDGELVYGAAVLSAGKCLVVDEAHEISRNGRQAMNSLLEGESFPRSLGFNLRRDVKDTRKRYYSIKGKQGTGYFNVKSQFSCLLAGIFAHRKTLSDEAFLSRFMPLNMGVSIDEAFKQLRGKETFSLKPRPFTEMPEFVDYLKFVDAYEESYKQLLLMSGNGNRGKKMLFKLHKIGYFKRNLGDFCRLCGYMNQGNSVVEDWEKYIPYIPLFMHNYFTSTLTLTEFEILDGLKRDMEQKEIAGMVACSENYVSLVKKKLRGYNLVG